MSDSFRIAILWGIVFILALTVFIIRKKIRILPSFIMTVTIVVFALLVPNGKILFRIRNFPVTQGALFSGLYKSAVLLITVFTSRIFISSKLNFPGKAGRLISKIFIYYGRFTSEKINLDRKNITVSNLISSIDKKLMEIWSTESDAE